MSVYVKAEIQKKKNGKWKSCLFALDEKSVRRALDDMECDGVINSYRIIAVWEV